MTDPVDYLLQHRTFTILLLVFCLGISAFLASRMWLRHPSERFLLKVIWSLILLFPILGWVLYFGFFQPPPVQPLSQRARGDDAASIGGHGGL